ncbi:hypothetical protein F511_41466 [Dorcoceras hygrometricum]|uniref:Uncharacterized protein n=1 Tax=Dorcoceras hygrometricum TaxID=472368 RepID=A0A2Z7B0Y5_9LAMI|nr:hypothetical protein F511_41466 [Dorcoceras hygrometricum]
MLKAEVENLTKEMSSWTQSARAFHKLQEIQKSAHDRTDLGFSNSESSEEETSTQSQPAYDMKSRTLDYTTLTLAPNLSAAPPLLQPHAAGRRLVSPPSPPLAGICSGQLFEKFPSTLISSGLLVQADEGVSLPVMDLIDAVNVKAGSFDAVTTERFQMIMVIHFGLKVNWSKVLFNVLKDMVDKSQKKAKGFAAQIGILLKSMPAITMGDGVPFPNAKILKTVNTYIATNIAIYAHGGNVEPGLAKVAVVKRTPKSKKKSSSTDETPVEVISEIAGSKKRQATEAQDVVPLQIVDPTPAAAAIKSPAPKSISRKRRLILPTGSDDESIATQKPVKDTHEVAVKPTDEVDMIIEQVLEETLDLGVSEETQGGQRVDEAAFTDDFVCTEIVQYHMFGCLRPVREDVCTDIVVYNFGIERIPASFRNYFAQGILTESYVGYFQDTDVHNFSDFEESSSDGSTVYRSPSPLRDESLALGPTAAHEEQFYFVQSPDSIPATSPCLETSTSSTSISMNFDTDDISLAGAAGIHTSLRIGRTDAILSKLHTLERGLRDALHDQDANTRKLINSVCQDAHTMSDVQKIHLNDVKKVVLAQGVAAGADSLEIRKEFKALDANINSMDGQVAAIRNEQLEFQTKIAADILSLSTQIGDLVEYIRGGDGKKGESRSRRPLPTLVVQSEGTGAAVRVTEPTQADIDAAQQDIFERMARADRERARERRERTLSRSGAYKRRRGH